MQRTETLQRFIDDFSKVFKGISMTEAIREEVCVVCRQKTQSFKNQQSLKEYHMSGLCQTCQDSLFK